MKTTKKVLQILLPLVLLLCVFASCEGNAVMPEETTAPPQTTAATTAPQTTAAQTTAEQTTSTPPTVNTPPSYVYVNGADEMTLEEAYGLLFPENIQLSVDMGYVTHDSIDVYAGKAEWDEFVRLVDEGTPAVVRGTKFFPSPGGTDGPDVYVYDVIYDGKVFWYKIVNKYGRLPDSCYTCLTYIEDEPTSETATFEKVYVYILSYEEATSYFKQFKEPEFVGGAPKHETPYCDYVYKSESN